MAPHQTPAEAASRSGLAHAVVRMTGRDPKEEGRVSTPLELLFDLTFVVAVGTAADKFAELLAGGHVGGALLGFGLAMFAISVAWINFTWFASAFDTDDWVYRMFTMGQMIGVVVFALGLPSMFHSIEEGGHLDMRAIVLGYVVMRVAMSGQWWRAARQSPAYRTVCMANIRWVLLLQIGWVVLALLHIGLVTAFIGAVVLGALELLLPVFAQGHADGTPWHPHHIAERYGLFAIITLGEGVVGTVASSQGLLGGDNGTHWTWNAVAVVVCGVGLTFGMWWVYFATPFGELLELRPRRGYLFGYGHILVFVAIAATGAGLHVAGLYLEHESALHRVAVVLSIAIPVGGFLLLVYGLHTLLFSFADKVHIALIALTVAVLVLAVVLAAFGAPTAWCLLVVTVAPFVSVVGAETVGHNHQQVMFAALEANE